jgi:hypothetical protein
VERNIYKTFRGFIGQDYSSTFSGSYWAFEAINCARAEIYISTDLNYRSKLWKYGKIPNDYAKMLH